MNARFSGFSLPIYLVRFTSGRPGKARTEPLDIGSAEAVGFMSVDAGSHGHLEGFGAGAQGPLERPACLEGRVSRVGSTSESEAGKGAQSVDNCCHSRQDAEMSRRAAPKANTEARSAEVA